ncbi:MAG: hypothetical protein PHQ04_11375 [Opitutaceae bacterium]|nr:hypothetical protein [Opitutaceae bacterium]
MTAPAPGFFCRLLGLLALSAQLSAFSLAVPPASQDLGQGLAYVRVHALADAIPSIDTALRRPQSLVLDLRYSSADEASAAAFRTALAASHSAFPLVLVSPATPPPLAEALATLPVRILTLGVPGSRPEPRVVIQTAPESDRLAYDAHEAGTPIGPLISGKLKKDRYDEASLAKDFGSGNHNAEPPPSPDPTAAKTDPKTTATNPPTDLVLQRAVQLHRALLALGRLPGKAG